MAVNMKSPQLVKMQRTRNCGILIRIKDISITALISKAQGSWRNRNRKKCKNHRPQTVNNINTQCFTYIQQNWIYEFTAVDVAYKRSAQAQDS